MKNRILTILTAVSLLGCCRTEKVNNVIFMIGDGMGIYQVYAASMVKGAPLYMMSQADKIAMEETWSANNKVTDSAASATALACGVKTNNNMVGMSPDTVPVESILEMAARNGKSAGVVVTQGLPYATPAGFTAHRPKRSQYEDIALDMVGSGATVMIGGGRRYFEHRTDSCNLSDSLRMLGFDVVYSLDEMTESSSDKVVALCDSVHMPDMLEGRGDFLPRATALALERLSRNPKGFFLMVEGSKIDNGGHDRNIEKVVTEVLDFDRAVQEAVEFARKDGHTLVVVTADHETGGLVVLDKKGRAEAKELKHQFTTNSHTGEPVPIYVFGPDGGRYHGLMQNSDHKQILQDLMKLK